MAYNNLIRHARANRFKKGKKTRDTGDMVPPEHVITPRGKSFHRRIGVKDLKI